MKNLFSKFLDLIYRRKCYFCKSSRESKIVCSSCYDKLCFSSFVPNRKIMDSQVYCAALYNGNIQKLVRGLKYHNQRDLAYYQAKFMYEYWQKLDINDDFEVVPVPLFSAREKKRKYNHMKLVCDEFCNFSGYTPNYELIYRVKNTAPQYNLNRVERMKNLESAFKVFPDKYLGKKLLILDDICTTGSTFESMIKEFNLNDIHDITCFTTASAT